MNDIYELKINYICYLMKYISYYVFLSNKIEDELVHKDIQLIKKLTFYHHLNSNKKIYELYYRQTLEIQVQILSFLSSYTHFMNHPYFFGCFIDYVNVLHKNLLYEKNHNKKLYTKRILHSCYQFIFYYITKLQPIKNEYQSIIKDLSNKIRHMNLLLKEQMDIPLLESLDDFL